MKRSKPSAPPKSPRNPGSSTTSWQTPRPTDVLAYAYLWHRESAQGQEEGIKDRPVVVVLALQKRSHGTELVVVPVTTRPPRAGRAAVEIPLRVIRHLGLTAAQCWIVTDEVNRFTWPGPDIRPVAQREDISPFYGSIPARLFDLVRASLAEVARSGGVRETKRTQ